MHSKPDTRVDAGDDAAPDPGRAAREDEDDVQLPRTPHEHDQSPDSQASGPHEVLEQAHRDIEEGQQDTDRRGMRGYEKPENRILHRRRQRGDTAADSAPSKSDDSAVQPGPSKPDDAAAEPGPSKRGDAGATSGR